MTFYINIIEMLWKFGKKLFCELKINLLILYNFIDEKNAENRQISGYV